VARQFSAPHFRSLVLLLDFFVSVIPFYLVLKDRDASHHSLFGETLLITEPAGREARTLLPSTDLKDRQPTTERRETHRRIPPESATEEYLQLF
jgi:hypothetical protein